jgi:hypothetical protein
VLRLTKKYFIFPFRSAIVISQPSSNKSGGSSSGKGKTSAESLMGGLRELLKEADALVVSPTAEEKQLRALITDTERILKTSRAVLSVCCNWESTAATSSTSLPDVATLSGCSSSKSAPFLEYRRPSPFTASYVKELLRLLVLQENNSEQASQYNGKKPSMNEVSALLLQAQLSPVKISEMSYVKWMYEQGLSLFDCATTIIGRAAQLSTAKSKLTLDRERYNLGEVHKLLQNMNSFPFSSDELDALQNLIDRTEAWRKEVGHLVGSSDEQAEAEGGSTKLTGGRSSGSAHSSRKAAAVANKPIPLKKVEALIAEGERFPFDLKTELEVLREKKALAKVWLEKLKRSFVPTKVTSGRSKKTGADGAASSGASQPVDEKLTLSDMKMMVSEGESLYQTSVDGEGGSGSGSSAPRGVNRDLDRALTVVETAEDWIARAWDIMQGGSNGREESSSCSGEGDTEGATEDNNGQEDSASEEEENHPERTMQMLRQMLDEVESMPVALEEAGLLRCHLQALEWAAKVAPLLASEDSSCSDAHAEGESSGAVDDENLDKQKSTKSSLHSSKLGAALSAKRSQPKLSEIQLYAKEISRFALISFVV